MFESDERGTGGRSDTAAAVLSLDELVAEVRARAAAFDPALLAPEAVGPTYDAWVAIRRYSDAAVTRLTPRFERSGAWKDRGEKSPEDAIASATGESAADGLRRLKTGTGARKESLYELDGKPITIREIRASGLARRPTSRNRKPV